MGNFTWPFLVIFVFMLPNWVTAQGPGLGNLTYQAHELLQPISIIRSPQGHGNVAMVNGYLMVIYSSDGGGSAEDGGIEFWDVSDPRNPRLVVRHDNADTHGLREAHGFAFSNSYSRHYLVAQALHGVQFWDISDPWHLALVNYLPLPGIRPGDYQGAWWVFWQAPYVYVAGRGSGLYVVDATDPAHPLLVHHVPTSQMGSLSPAMAFAIGNLLILMENQSGSYATMDISDPVHPVLIQHFTGKRGYSHLFAAGKIFSFGGSWWEPSRMYVHTITPEGSISFAGSVGSDLGNGGYGSYQDGLLHAGFSTQYAQFAVATLTQVGTGSSGLAGRDEDFAQVLGNLVFVGDDRGAGSALLVHQTTPDTTGPAVHWVHPRDGATQMALTTRVGVSMSDNIDVASVDSTTFIVRPKGGQALPGKYSVQMGVVNFTPHTPLQPNTTYEVIVQGMKDFVGNTGARFTSTFSTTATPSPLRCTILSSPKAEVHTTVHFQRETVSGREPITYSWDFGDGSAPTPSSEEATAYHSYTAPGRYGVVLTVQNATGSATCSTVQIIHNPLTALPAVSSSTIIHNGVRSFNVNSDHDTVTAINAQDWTKAWEVPVGNNPRTLAEAPNGDIWVVNQGDATISILRASDGRSRHTIVLPFASQPYGIVFSPDKRAAYVSLQGTGRLLKLTPAGTIVGDIAIGSQPRGIAISGDSRRILVTRFISAAQQGEVYEVEATTFTVKRTFALAFDPGPDTESSGRGVPNSLSFVRISPDGKRAYVPSPKDNVARGWFRDGHALTFESTVRTIVSQIDLEKNTEDLRARIDLDNRNMAQSLLFSPVGDIFFVATQGTNTVEVYDANDQTLLGMMHTGLAPQGMVFNSDASQLYVHNWLSRTISIFDTRDFIQAINNAATKLAEVSTVAHEVLPAQVLQGKKLFYNAADPRMNRDGYLSCASCHLDGGSDGQVWDFTQHGEGLRNTISLIGRADLGHGPLHWAARFDEIQDFEHEIRELWGGTGFLSPTDFQDTADPLGKPKAGLSPDLDALAAYVSSLTTFPSSPYRNTDGALTAQGQAGKRIFITRRCPACHSGPFFTDRKRHDVGTIQASSGLGIGQPLPGVGFQTPTLKGLWNTAPYFHNGQAATLYDVLNTRGHGDTARLTTQEIEQLVAYLLQIDAHESLPAHDTSPFATSTNIE